MNKILVMLLFFLLISCDNTIGSDDVNELTNLEFSIDDEREVTSTALIVKGSVINTGTIKVSSPWYIEGMFYSDTNFTTILGGANQRINIPLEPGVNYNWVLTFSSNDIIEASYPNFGFRNLRGYINQ
tara:strand:+ start:1006 stop:1389 length:384 start_codon:yes stop_codon:yes gene_type:complete